MKWRIIVVVIVLVWLAKIGCVEIYRVASPAMEGALKQGDRVLVSKYSYGVRLPITPLALPFVRDSLFGMQCYVGGAQLPYTRIFASFPQRNDVILYNHPRPLHTVIPIDRRKLLLSRCVGLPGDSVVMQSNVLYINGEKVVQSPYTSKLYLYEANDENIIKKACDQLKISPVTEKIRGGYVVLLSNVEYYRLQQQLGNNSNLLQIQSDENWRAQLPAKDQVIKVTPYNVSFLYPIIVLHECVPVKKIGSQLFLNDKEVSYFLFKQDYCFTLSDNRAVGNDSRVHGVVPFSHIIGKVETVVWSSATLPNVPQ